MEFIEERDPHNDAKKLSFYELIYGVLFQPKNTFKRIAIEPPLFYAFLLFLGVTLINSILGFITAAPIVLPPDTPREIAKFISVFRSPAMAVLGAIVSTTVALIFWFLRSAIIQLLAEFFGGKGRGLGVMTVLGVSTLPQILVIPFSVLVYIFSLPASIIAIISFPIAIWSQIILPILGLREVHQFSLGRALLTIITPLIFTLGLIIVSILGVITLIATFLA